MLKTRISFIKIFAEVKVFHKSVGMTDEEMHSGDVSGEEDGDALVFHILITEPLTKLK